MELTGYAEASSARTRVQQAGRPGRIRANEQPGEHPRDVDDQEAHTASESEDGSESPVDGGEPAHLDSDAVASEGADDQDRKPADAPDSPVDEEEGWDEDAAPLTRPPRSLQEVN